MKVSELKQLLERYDEDAPIAIEVTRPDDDPQWNDIEHIQFDPHEAGHCLLKLGGLSSCCLRELLTTGLTLRLAEMVMG